MEPFLRRLVFASALAACADAGQAPPSPGGASYPEVALPLARDLDPDPRRVEVRLEALTAGIRVVGGAAPVEMWTYDGLIPGPVIRARRGDRLIVHFHNRLPAPTTIHWHGLRVPAAMDGSHLTQGPIPPGGTFEYAFDLLDAGTFWYHPHHLSHHQVGFGLYAPLVVDDPDEPAAALGRDAVLVLSDVSLTGTAGGLAPGDEGGPERARQGREGALVLVNGRHLPTVRVAIGERQRWRLVNAARSRFFRLQLEGHRLTRIGGDGGLLEAPQPPVEELLLAPGERAEVVVALTAAAGARVPLLLVPYDRGGEPPPGGPAAPSPIMFVETTAAGTANATPALPPRLRAIERLTPAADAPHQLIRIGERPEGFVVNERPFAGNEPLRARVGETHLFSVTNHTRFDHPFHLHGFFFQVLDPQTLAPAEPAEWKDTVNVTALGATALAVRFDDRPGPWMFHCHILDHAELGLMGVLDLTR